MSYSTIRAALATRLNAVSAVGKAHPYVRYSKQPAEHVEFQTLFMERQRVNVWQITRTSFVDTKAPEDDITILRRHKIEIYAVLSVKDSSASENTHQDALDAVADDIRIGSRSLNGACHTMSLLTVDPIERVMFFENILCHQATLKLEVEELLQ